VQFLGTPPADARGAVVIEDTAPSAEPEIPF